MDYERVMEGNTFDKEGLSTNLGPTSKSAMKCSEQLESFLTQIEI